MMRYLVSVLLACLAGLSPLRAQEHNQGNNQERINVVASFSIIADLVRNVGGDRVSLTTLVGNQGDVHVYVPSAGDAMRIAKARLVVVNGLGLEGWLERLVQSSGSKAQIVTASAGITARREDAKPDPHAWQSVPNVRIYVGNIADALSAESPKDADYFRSRSEAYLEKLMLLDREARDMVAAIAPERRVVISTHDAFGYFTAEYGIRFIAPLGVSTDTEPAAGDIAAIIRQIRAEKIPAVFLENVSDERLIRRIAAETGAKVGGTLFSDSLTDENGPAPTYIDMVRHNIRVLSAALGQ